MLGLWEKSFTGDLNWSVVGQWEEDEEVGKGEEEKRKKWKKKIADIPLLTGPSWSWLSYPEWSISGPQRSFYSRGSDTRELRLDSFDVQWTGSPFTSRVRLSKLHVSGVVKSFKVIKPGWGEYGFHIEGSRNAEVSCNLDDGSELFDGLHITCLFLWYQTDHWEHEGPDFKILEEASRTEYFLLLSPVLPSGLSASEPIVIPESDDMRLKVYRRLGVGCFELKIIHKDIWKRQKRGEYDNIRWPNPRLMFDGSERVTMKLV